MKYDKELFKTCISIFFYNLCVAITKLKYNSHNHKNH